MLCKQSWDQNKMYLWNLFQSTVVRDERGLLKIIAWFHAKSFFDLESVNLKLLRHHQQSIPHLSPWSCVLCPQSSNLQLTFGILHSETFLKTTKKIFFVHLKPEVYFVQVISNEIEPKIDGISVRIWHLVHN